MSPETTHCNMMHLATSPPSTIHTQDPERDAAGCSAALPMWHILQKGSKEDQYPREVPGRQHGGGVYLPGPLSSPILHWPRLTPGGTNTRSFPGCIIQPFRSLSTCQISSKSKKMKGQPGEVGAPTKRERKWKSWKPEKPQKAYFPVQLIKPYLG